MTDNEQPINEFRVFGPPGTGKTTFLSRQVRNAVEKEKRVLITSLTRTAANEVVGRDLPIPPEWVGTLHAHCWHALGRPSIAQSASRIAEDWNTQYEHYRLTTTTTHADVDEDNTEPPIHGTDADRLMAQYQAYRARMTPIDKAPESLRAFARTWEDWKQANGLLDFTDLIETCLRDTRQAPGEPDILLVDETQDMDLLEMSLIRQWGRNAEYLVTVGDPDQCIFNWRGADPTAFVEPPVPRANVRVLQQSYRIPRAVHQHAMGWITRVSSREPVDYLPRDEDGQVRHLEHNHRAATQIVQDAQQYLAQGKTVMFLATCSFILDPLITELREQGVPFHNPYRPTNGAWNPLAPRQGQVTASQRTLAFLQLSASAEWTAEDLRRWTEPIRSKEVLPRNGKKYIQLLAENNPGGPVDWEVLQDLFSQDTIQACLTGDLDWFQSHLLKGRSPGFAFPINIARRGNPADLSDRPRLIVGSIHSAKGSEADVVYLFPDLSRPGMHQWCSRNPREVDAVYRLFYVGMTRARETLVLCQPYRQNRHAEIW